MATSVAHLGKGIRTLRNSCPDWTETGVRKPPKSAIRELRELTRYRKTQVDARAREIQRLEKVLQDAGIKLTSVASAVRKSKGQSPFASSRARKRTFAKPR